MDEADVPETSDAGAGKPDMFSLNLLSLSLTDADGDPKVYHYSTLLSGAHMYRQTTHHPQHRSK